MGNQSSVSITTTRNLGHSTTTLFEKKPLAGSTAPFATLTCIFSVEISNKQIPNIHPNRQAFTYMITPIIHSINQIIFF